MPLSTAAFPCCRDHDLFAPVEEYPQRIHRTPGDEAYWFCWDSSFDGKATIRIAKLRDDVMVSRIYRASRVGKADDGRLVPTRRRHCRRELLDTDIVVFLWETTQKNVTAAVGVIGDLGTASGPFDRDLPGSLFCSSDRRCGSQGLAYDHARYCRNRKR